MPAESLLPLVGREPAVPRVLELRSHYGVSAFAMAHRLHALERLSDWAYRQDCVHLTQRGYRSGEPGGLPRERSRVFSVMLSTLAQQGSGPTEIADELGLDVGMLHDLLFGQFVMGLGRNGGEDRRSVGTPQAESLPRLRLV